MGRAVTLAGMIWFLCVGQCVALDSSVGRAVDCSCDCQTSIGRWFKSGSREFLPYIFNNEGEEVVESRLRPGTPITIPR